MPVIVPSGTHVTSPKRPPSWQTPGHFARRDFRSGNKHNAKGGRDRIESCVFEWQCFGIGNAEVDVRGQRLCSFDYTGSEIDPGHFRAA
jgi:hypothetical protein